MEIEVWKPIEGYEGIYEVSSFGRVRSLDRIVDFGNENYSRQMLCKGKIMKGSISHNGYIYVSLCLQNKKVRTYIHRLVANAFIPNPNNLSTVNHKDGNKHNNTVANLEWASYSDNNQHAYDNGLVKSKRRVRRIRCIETGEIYKSGAEASRKLGYDASTILRTCHGIYETLSW